MATKAEKIAHYRKLLNDPNKRAAIPDQWLRRLSPDLYQKRQAAQRMKQEDATIYNPLAPLTGRDLARTVRSQVDLELNPQIAAKQREIEGLGTQATTLSQRLGSYYGQVGQAAAAGQQNAITARDTLTSELAGNAAQTQQAITNAEQQQQAASAQDAAIRGTGLDAGTAQRLAAEFAQQKIAAAQQSQLYQDQGAIQAQGAVNVANVAAMVLPARAADAQATLASQMFGKIAEATAQKSDIEAQRGPLTAKTLTDLRQSEFEKAATSETLKLKGTQQEIDKTNAAANRRATAQNQENKVITSGAFQGLTNKEARNLSQSEVDKRVRDYNRQIHPPKKGTTEKPYSSGAFAGMTPSQVTALSPGAKAKKINDYNAVVHPGKDKKSGDPTEAPLPGGIKPLPTVSYQKQVTLFEQLRKFAGQHKDKGRHKLATDLTNATVLKALNMSGASPAVVSAALDAIFLGYISNGTAQKLHQAGIRVSSLGVEGKGGKGGNPNIPGSKI